MSFNKRFKETFVISMWEAIVALIIIIFFTIVRFSGLELNTTFIIIGFLAGIWLTFRPSEWAVEGLKSGSEYVGLSEYVAGVFSSLASNLPEAVIALFLILGGEQLMAVITVLSAAGFNTLILGMAILIGSGKKGHVKVPEDLDKKEGPIIRWAVVAILMTVVFGLVEYSMLSGNEDALLTRPVSAMLALSYVIYLIFIVIKREPDDETEEEVQPHLSKGMTIVFLIMGFAGIFYGGETLTFCVEHLLEHSEIPIPALALILGAAGSIPEHGIAVISSAKGEMDVALGNAIGGILQSVLLVFGILGVVVSIIMTRFILLQLASIAAVLWFTKRSMHDDKKFDIFEGIMILLLQILIFVILIEELLLIG